MKTCYKFSESAVPGIKQVGGKGLSLMLMTQAGFPVPRGFILSVDFFEPWFKIILGSSEWQDVLSASPDTLDRACEKVKERCESLALTASQNADLKRELAHLKETHPIIIAVRSSSPEEDLEGASFAGGYETSLGVTEATLERAIKHSFASCFDKRVWLYKKEKGFTTTNPQIAVVIQQQIPSDVSGVAFTLNPLNNCFDELVINANFGLGESVVAGRVSPDEIIVDKVTHRIINKKTGAKKTGIWLLKDGGTEERSNRNPDSIALTDQQIIQLTNLCKKVEEYYEKPMDLEWAFSKNSLHLLQARPITAYIPIPIEMQTLPGEPKILYMDHIIVKQGVFDALSVLGLDYLERMQRKLIGSMMGTEKVIDLHNGLYGNCGGRGYANITNTIKMRGIKQVISVWETQDSITADILSTADLSEYIPRSLPKQLKGVLLKTIFANIGTIRKVVKAYGKPDEYHSFLKKEMELLKQDLEENNLKADSFTDAAETNMKRYNTWLIDVSLPVTYAAELARSNLKKLFKNDSREVRDKLYRLEQALPNNITIEMGLAMYHLSTFSDIVDCATGTEFLQKLSKKDFSLSFLKAWDEFMKTYGHRCTREIDIASPRFHETPEILFNQLKTMSENTNKKNNPKTVFEQGIINREKTYKELLDILEKKSKGKVKKFKKFYHILVTLGAYREIHKYYYIKIIDMFKQKIMEFAKKLAAENRIDTVQQIFDMKINHLNQAAADPNFDIRNIIEENTQFIKKISHVHNFPRLIDSRGKILKPEKKSLKEGELSGEPISPGKITGKVKVLHTPDEKPILPGEILVARATDPGWTPLFLNAGGIVLEIGGLLQHGALVAREYCKPCIAGIENVITLLKDGQEIEMDGTTGTIRILHK